MCLTRAAQRGRITSLDLLAMLFLMHTRTRLAFLATRTPLAHGPGSTRTPSPSPQSCFPTGCPQPVQVHGVVLPQMLDPAFTLAEFHTFLLCPSLQPVTILLKGCTAFQGISHSSQLGVVTELAEAASASSSKSLMHKLNNSGHSTDPWGTVTGLQQEPVPSMRTL